MHWHILRVSLLICLRMWRKTVKTLCIFSMMAGLWVPMVNCCCGYLLPTIHLSVTLHGPNSSLPGFLLLSLIWVKCLMALFGIHVTHLFVQLLNMLQALLCYHNVSFCFFLFLLCTSNSDWLYQLFVCSSWIPSVIVHGMQCHTHIVY